MSDASDRRIGRDDLKECWCCDGLHDGLGLLCPKCDDAGCQYFDGECKSDHKPVLPDGGIIIAGIEYMCRVCGNETTIYVKPVIDDRGRPAPDFDSKHRIVQHDCRECEQERTYVAVQTLSEEST